MSSSKAIPTILPTDRPKHKSQGPANQIFLLRPRNRSKQATTGLKPSLRSKSNPPLLQPTTAAPPPISSPFSASSKATPTKCKSSHNTATPKSQQLPPPLSSKIPPRQAESTSTIKTSKKLILSKPNRTTARTATRSSILASTITLLPNQRMTIPNTLESITSPNTRGKSILNYRLTWLGINDPSYIIQSCQGLAFVLHRWNCSVEGLLKHFIDVFPSACRDLEIFIPFLLRISDGLGRIDFLRPSIAFIAHQHDDRILGIDSVILHNSLPLA